VGGTCSTHGGGETCLQGFGREVITEKTTGRPRHRWEITLSWTSGRYGSMGQTGFGWLRIGSGGGPL
jgi:hypothetical protein